MTNPRQSAARTSSSISNQLVAAARTWIGRHERGLAGAGCGCIGVSPRAWLHSVVAVGARGGGGSAVMCLVDEHSQVIITGPVLIIITLLLLKKKRNDYSVTAMCSTVKMPMKSRNQRKNKYIKFYPKAEANS